MTTSVVNIAINMGRKINKLINKIKYARLRSSFFPDTVAKSIGKETLLTRWYGSGKGINLY